MIRKIWLCTAFSLVLISALALSAAAQTVTGSLVGRVDDPNGAAVPGARVVAIETTRGTTRETTTNEEGNFTFSSVDPGVYRVEIEQANFKKTVQNNVEVAINSTVRVDTKLEAGGVTETVQVESEAVQLKTDRADVSTQISNEQVEELPLSIDRNYQSILDVSPGVTEAEELGSGFGNPNGSLRSRVNGQNERYNNFQLDGTINNQTNVISQTAIVPPPEAIQVVDVSTNSFDAEQGRGAGGVINVQIKSGTNKFRGSAWIYNTNSAFKAQNTLSTLEVPVTNLNQFGAVLGGPIVKDKTFFFGDFQIGRDRRGQNTILSVPTLAYRNGDFSGAISPTTNCTPPNNSNGPVNTPSGCIFDPGVNGQIAAAARVQFAGNRIPDSRINPAARALFARLPLPNRPGNNNNLEVTGLFRQRRDSFDVKVNHNFTENTTAFVRYSFFKSFTSDLPAFGDLGGQTTGGGGTAAEGPGQNHSISANVTHVFNSNLITEFRFGYVRVHISGDTPSEENLGNTLGIPNTNQGDFFTNEGIPNISLTSTYTSLGTIATIPFDIKENSYNIVNNWTVTRGNHTIRFGGDLRRLRLDKYQAGGSPRGSFTFTGGLTTRTGTAGSVNAVAAFLLGLPQSVSKTTVAQLGGYIAPQYFFYAQDRWQVNPRLTVNYGLRYEIYPYPTGINPGDQSFYDPESNTVLISGYGPINDRINVKTQYNNIAPRLGVAYRLDDKTVARAGYSIAYVPITLNTLISSYGSQITQTIQGTNANSVARDLNGNPITLSTGIPNPQIIDLTSGVVVPPVNTALGVGNQNARRGYVQSFNFTVERDLFGYLASVGYVGSLGTRMPGTVNINAGGPGSTNATLPFSVRYGRTAQITLTDFMLSNSYHSLQSRIDKRFKQLGGRLTVAYTFSKSLDYTSAFAIDNDINYDLNRGPSDFDRRHNLVVSHVIRPFGARGGRLFDENGLRWQGLLGGFTLSGIFTARSGTPVDVTGIGGTNTAVIGTTNRPNQVGQVTYLGGTGPGDPFFVNNGAFVDPAPFTFGTAARNSLRGPSYFNYNATLSRTFSFSERKRLQASMAVFNVTNTPHFKNPSGNLLGGFGVITESFGERQVRFGLKFSY